MASSDRSRNSGRCQAPLKVLLLQPRPCTMTSSSSLPVSRDQAVRENCRPATLTGRTVSGMGATDAAAQLSTCPRSRPGAMRSRRRCFSSLASGKRPSLARDHSTSPSTRTSKMPPSSLGLRDTDSTSASKVLSSSCAIQAARNSQRHPVQYSISMRALMSFSPART